MREIKFKIWDRQANRWAENDCSLHCATNWQIDPFTGQLTDFVSALDSDEVTRYNADPAPDYYWKDGQIVNEPRYVLVQYTGLKDKNGVEIYEGDILRVISPGSRLWCNHVYYEDASYKFNTWNLYDFFEDLDICVEVVGHIFENPELLEQ